MNLIAGITIIDLLFSAGFNSMMIQMYSKKDL